MTTGNGNGGAINLGAGVHLAPASGDQLLIRSQQIDLGWKPPQGVIPGTTVFWQDQPFQVISRERSGSGWSWRLAPWPANEAARNVFRLDQASIAELARVYRREQEAAKRRTSTILLLPLLGFAPGALQQRWWDEWGFPARLATLISAGLSMLFGAAGLIQLLAARSGDGFLPESLSWLAVVGPYLLAESAVRLPYTLTQGEPIGSLFGLPLHLFFKPPPPPSQIAGSAPQARRFDPEQGALELWSATLRRDWEEPGVLPYRGQRFQLQRLKESGGGWMYHFNQVSAEHAGDLPALRLLPTQASKPEPQRAKEPMPSFVKTTFVSAIVCLAPQIYQERWAEQLEVNPIWFTALGSVAELLGGIANISTHLSASSPLLVLDLLLVGEGLVRLGWMLVDRQAVGSVLGLPLGRLYEYLTN